MKDSIKKEIMIHLDHAVGSSDLNDIDELLEEMIKNFEHYDIQFLKLVLGYVGIYQKDLKYWNKLYYKVEEKKGG